MSVAWVPKIGAEFGGYRLESLIGHGGMSIVYRAQHLSLERIVALKLLAPQLSEDESFRERFLRESRMAAALDHPNVIPIYEAGEADGVFYIAMRYVEGLDLKTLLKREGPLPLERTSSILGQVASALGAAHAKGLVHRDVKPANILIAARYGPEDSDHVYLSDFGVVKHGASQPLTQTGMFVGTAEYASPEQIEGKELDGRADVYALGCVLYECLTGDPAYDKDSEVALMYAHLLEPPPVAGEKRPGLPPQVDEVVAKGMAKQRDERYATPRDLAVAFREAVGLGPAGTSAGATELSTGSETVLAGAGAAAGDGGTGAPPGVPPTMASVPPPAQPAGTQPPAAPPVAPAPPSTGGGGMSGRAKLIAAIVGVLVLIGVGVGAALALTGGESNPEATTKKTADSLISVLAPTEIANACIEVEPPASGAVETQDCSNPAAPTEFPDSLTLSFYRTAKALNAAFNEQQKNIEFGRCGASEPGVHEWLHQYKTPPGKGGRVFCYTAGNESVIVWTHDKHGSPDHFDMLGIAKEAGARSKSAFDWWNTSVGGGKTLHDKIGVCRAKAKPATFCTDTIVKFS